MKIYFLNTTYPSYRFAAFKIFLFKIEKNEIHNWSYQLNYQLSCFNYYIYAINFIAGFAGADYTFTNGEVFVIWILMAILVNNCFNK